MPKKSDKKKFQIPKLRVNKQLISVTVWILFASGLILIGFIGYDLIVEKVTAQQVELIARLLSVFLSWPIIALIFIIIFRLQLAQFLQNLQFIKAPGFEATSQPPSIQSESVEESVTISTEERGVNLTSEQIATIENYLRTQNDQIEANNETIKYLAIRSEIYEFSFLGLYLVPNSKLALAWIKSQGRITKEFFYNNFRLIQQNLVQAYIPNAYRAEKENIFNALITNDLIQIEGEIITITAKGDRFMEFINQPTGN
ncbi:hypothetical protein HYV12_01865 [Candidatus Dojkabacteria bacterium]|nr:hypothetical protein [Candidatus Dojkabacteria bacterium]